MAIVIKGISYDTGLVRGPVTTRSAFDVATVRHDMRVIAADLRCDAVCLFGDDPTRLCVAAQEAAATGMEVWFAPFPLDLDARDTLRLLADGATGAEAVRRGGAEVVFVTGYEHSLLGRGYLPGDSLAERVAAKAAGRPWPVESGGRLNAFLAEAVRTVRPLFGGRVTYASGPWEPVDWEPFDLVGVDAYQAADLRTAVGHGKPVAVTEFGTCAYRGAAALGDAAYLVPTGAVPDEGEQVRYFEESMEVFEMHGVAAAFWNTFAGYGLSGRDDLASYGTVRMVDTTRWEPRSVFHTIAAWRSTTRGLRR